ncbi:MAG: hypothetical protein AB8G86_27395 [Saprospiraceae bacterium]
MHLKIKKLLKLSEFSIAEIAVQVATSESTIRNFKAGRNEPSVAFLKFLFTEFPDLNPKWLFFDEGEMLLKDEQNSESQLRIELLEKKVQEIQPLVKSLKKKLDQFLDGFDEVDLDALIKLIKAS